MKKDSKEKIMDAALKEFSKNFYDNASLNRIIASSKTSKGTFYHYFKSKNDLYFKVIDKVVKEKLEFINRRMSEEFSKLNEICLFDENFRMITKIAMEFGAENPLYYDFGVKMLSEPNSDIIQKITKKYGNKSEEFVKNLIGAMYKSGKINTDLSEEFVVKLVTFVLTNYSLFIPEGQKNDIKKMTKYLDQIYFVLENGIKPKSNK